MRNDFSGSASAADKARYMVKVDALDSPAGTSIFAFFAALGSNATATTFFSLVVWHLSSLVRAGKAMLSALLSSASSSLV